jgi:hypothetical protein
MQGMTDEQLHTRLERVITYIFKTLDEAAVPEKDALVALSMAVAKLTVVVNIDAEIVCKFIKSYYEGCVQNQRVVNSSLLN